MIPQPLNDKEKLTVTELPAPVRVTLNLSEFLEAAQVEILAKADHLIIDGKEFLSKERSVALVTEFGRVKGYDQIEEKLQKMKNKYNVLKTSYNLLLEEHTKLKKDAEHYKTLNRTFLQRVKDKLKK